MTTDPSNVICAWSYSGVLQEVGAPVSGRGPDAGSDHGGLLWTLLAASLAAAALAFGSAAGYARRRWV